MTDVPHSYVVADSSQKIVLTLYLTVHFQDVVCSVDDLGNPPTSIDLYVVGNPEAKAVQDGSVATLKYTESRQINNVQFVCRTRAVDSELTSTADVFYGPEAVTSLSTDTAVMVENSLFSWECFPTPSNPPAKVEYLLCDDPEDGSTCSKIENTNELHAIRAWQHKYLKCTATNAQTLHKVASIPHKIDVHHPPRFLGASSNNVISVRQGEPFTLDCNHEANPEIVTYDWEKEIFDEDDLAILRRKRREDAAPASVVSAAETPAPVVAEVAEEEEEIVEKAPEAEEAAVEAAPDAEVVIEEAVPEVEVVMETVDKPAASEVEAAAPAVEEASPAVEEVAPEVKIVVEAVEKPAAPEVEAAAPAVEEASPAVEEVAPEVEDAVEAVDKPAASEVKAAAPAVEEASPEVDGASAPEVDSAEEAAASAEVDAPSEAAASAEEEESIEENVVEVVAAEKAAPEKNAPVEEVPVAKVAEEEVAIEGPVDAPVDAPADIPVDAPVDAEALADEEAPLDKAAEGEAPIPVEAVTEENGLVAFIVSILPTVEITTPRPLRPSVDLSNHNATTFSVLAAEPKHFGSYVCKAKNSIGENLVRYQLTEDTSKTPAELAEEERKRAEEEERKRAAEEKEKERKRVAEEKRKAQEAKNRNSASILSISPAVVLATSISLLLFH